MKTLQLSTADIIVFIGVTLLTIAAIAYGHWRKSKDASDSFLDYLVMGRQLTLPLFVATMVATWYGGIFGVTRISFESGIYNFVTQGAFWYLTYIFFALFMIKKVRSFEAVTLPELVGKMYGPKSAKLAGVFNVFNVIPIAYTISLGLLLQMCFGLDTSLAMILGVLFVSIYSLFGGFRSVVFSDMVQFFFMCFGVVLVAALAVSTYGGLSFLQSKLPEGHFSPTGGNSLATTLVWGFIAISTLVDPNFYQRCFAAKSEKTARNGILISTMIWFVFDICTTLGGMYARATMPEASSDTAYFYFAFDLLPSGFRGLFLASVVATVLSTIDSYLFIAGSTITYDLIKVKTRPVFKTRIGILSVAAVSIVMAQVFDGNIKAVWKTLGTYSSACLLFPIVCGYFVKKRISDYGFLWTCLGSAIATTYWRNASHSGFLKNIDELYIGVLTSALIYGYFLVTTKSRDSA